MLAPIEKVIEGEMKMSPMGKAAATRARIAPPDAAPAVLAASHLCELLEHAAARRIRPHLRAGESSVAVATKLRHLEIAVGGHGPLRVSVSQHDIAGRLHHFVVHAFDDRGLIAESEHTRAVVNDRRFVANARRRTGRLSMLLAV